jgi:hypothetical protein
LIKESRIYLHSKQPAYLCPGMVSHMTNFAICLTQTQALRHMYTAS